MGIPGISLQEYPASRWIWGGNLSDVWQKRILIIAGLWNLLGASALFDPGKHFQQLYTTSLSLDDPLQLFFFRCTWINVKPQRH